MSAKNIPALFVVNTFDDLYARRARVFYALYIVADCYRTVGFGYGHAVFLAVSIVEDLHRAAADESHRGRQAQVVVRQGHSTPTEDLILIDREKFNYHVLRI